MSDYSKLLNYRKPPVPVEIPELGDTFYVRTMSGTERDAFEVDSTERKGKSNELNRQNFRARLLVRCLCDDKGQRAMTDSQADALGQVPCDALDKLFSVAASVNGLSAKDQEELVKNLPAAPSGDSGSSSASSTTPPSASSSS